MWRKDGASAPTPPAETGIRLATFPRDNGKAELRINLDEFNGHKYVAARIWTLTDGWWPTKQGITIRLHEIEDVIEALRSIQQASTQDPRDRPHSGPDLRESRSPGNPRPRERGDHDPERPTYVPPKARRPEPRDMNREYPTPRSSAVPFDEFA